MESYFSLQESMDFSVKNNIKESLRRMAYRFMGDNPPEPFILRTYFEDGAKRGEDGSVSLDFSRWFPDAVTGDWGAAIGEILCHEDKQSSFMFKATGKAAVFLNRHQVLNCSKEGIYEFAVQLKEGKNRFLIVQRKEENFFCSLVNKMPQWEPYSYTMPFQERKGEAGFIYTCYEANDVKEDEVEVYFKDESFWGDRETGNWHPKYQMTQPPWSEDERWYVWTYAKFSEEGSISGGKINQWIKGCGAEQIDAFNIKVDGRDIGQAENELFSEGVHISCIMHTGNQAWDFLKAICSMKHFWQLQLPVEVEGEAGEFLFLGPLDEPTEQIVRKWKPDAEEFLTLPFKGRRADLFWKTKYQRLVIRGFVESHLYGRWTYPLGVTLYGMLMAGRYFHKSDMVEYVKGFMEKVVASEKYAEYDKRKWGFPGINQQLLWLDALDDCGSFGSGMLECVKDWEEEKGTELFIREADRIAHRIFKYMMDCQPRNPDGSFKRRDNSMWIDDMYMSVPFLARYAERYENKTALEEAVNQLLLYRNIMGYRDGEEGGILLSHMYQLEKNQPNRIPWSRGNGWVLFSLSELFRILPQNHEKREKLELFFRQLSFGVFSHQDACGLWHQILDEQKTYYETSGTAMFICAFSRGIQYGIFGGCEIERYKKSVLDAWEGLQNLSVDSKGNLYGVCRGSGWSYEREYYRNLSWNFNDAHGIGIVMLAGVETDKLKKWEEMTKWKSGNRHG